jgi:hypothetical protein
MGVALVALVVAASGGAYAAVKVSSPKITACVHHKGGGLYIAHECARHDARLDWGVAGKVGAQGKPGVMGLQGPAGQPGGPGIHGPPGPFPESLPSGKTLTGDYRTTSASGNFVTDTQSFAFPLASKPSVQLRQHRRHASSAVPRHRDQPEGCAMEPACVCGGGHSPRDRSRHLQSRDQLRSRCKPPRIQRC